MRNTTTVLFLITLMVLLGFSGMAVGQESESGSNGEIEVEGTTTTTTTSPSAPTSSDPSRPRVAVHTFENPPAYYSSTIGNGLTSILITHMTQSGRFDVIQRGENLELIIEEIELGRSGYIEQDTAVEMGHVLGVDYILSGRVTNFGYEETDTGGLIGSWSGFAGLEIEKEKATVRLDFALIDATTGTTVLAATAEGKESETGFSIEGGDWGEWVAAVSWDTDEFMESMIGQATVKAVENLMDQILVLFPIQARILAVTPSFIVLDLGSGSGIEEGMEFEVYRVEAVANEAGEVVWEDRTLIGRVQVTEVELTSCKANVVSGSDFVEGDLCILPEEQIVETETEGDSNPHRG